MAAASHPKRPESSALRLFRPTEAARQTGLIYVRLATQEGSHLNVEICGAVVCANVGCMPLKLLIAAARAARKAYRAAVFECRRGGLARRDRSVCTHVHARGRRRRRFGLLAKKVPGAGYRCAREQT